MLFFEGRRGEVIVVVVMAMLMLVMLVLRVFNLLHWTPNSSTARNCMAEGSTMTVRRGRKKVSL